MTLPSSTNMLLEGGFEMVSLLLGWLKFQQKLTDTMSDSSYFSNSMDKKGRLLLFENGCVLGNGSEIVSLILGWVKFQQKLRDIILDPP